jgi:glyoxylase-like metal-dependent hydrolase (beta-lactamase superfamily II)
VPTDTADPRPAQLPLAGGRHGATVRVHPLRTAEMLAPPGFYQRPAGPLGALRGLGILTPRSRWFRVPIPCFLVEHPEVGPLMVDTGMPAAVAEGVAPVLGRRAKLVYRVHMEPGWAASAQLRERDVDPDDVRVVVMTHLHYDHTAAVRDFPRATFVVDDAEWRAATRGGFLHGYRRALFDLPYDWRTIDFGTEDVDAFVTFGHAVDVFGDGSVRLLSTPGHTRGHLSVLLRLESRDLLLTGDAAYARRSIEEELVPVFLEDAHLYRRSLREIKRFVAMTPSAEVVCGHDDEGWAGVKPLYR